MTARARLPRRPGFSGLGWAACGLIFVLVALAALQARLPDLQRNAIESHDRDALLEILQVENAILRVVEQGRIADETRAPQDTAALAQGIANWLGAVDRLHAAGPRLLVGDDAASRQTLDQIDAVAAGARQALARAAPATASTSWSDTAAPGLAALRAPMRQLALVATRRETEAREVRSDALLEQDRLILGLLLAQGLLTGAFAIAALRQLRRHRQRRVAAATLAGRLRRARREGESASAAKSAFLANMSLEIRTPFHGLMGMLSLLREAGLTPHQIDHLRTATESADQLLAILNDILDLSQLDSGRMSLSPAPLALRNLLHEVEALMRPQAMAKSLALHIGADPEVPEHVLADGMRVKQVVFNLLNHAIQFCDQGTVDLALRCAEPEALRPVLEFVVSDTGVGMDEATVARLFNLFVRADARSGRHAGTGLGLEISRKLARLMGGDISVRSQPGAGSCFTFRLPVQALRGAAATPAADPVAGEPPARALHVLVAEDHPVNRQYLAALLDKLGHEAHFTVNGQEAVQAVREQRFDLVLMDLHMPVLDGVAATRAIRALPDPTRSTVPIMALTADAFDDSRERCLVAGMNDFLTKPVSPQVLATALRRLFGTPGHNDLAGAQVAGSALLSSVAGHPLVDEEALRMALQLMPAERLGGLVKTFLDQGAETVQRLRTAVRDGQPLELRVNAHAVKGAALNLGMAALAATAESLQEGAAHLPAHEIARLVQIFDEQLKLTRQAMQARGLLGHAPGTDWRAAAVTR